MNFEAINHDIRAAISRYYKYDHWTRDQLFIEFTNALKFMTHHKTGIISIPYVHESTFLDVINSFLTHNIKIDAFQYNSSYSEVLSERIPKVQIIYHY